MWWAQSNSSQTQEHHTDKLRKALDTIEGKLRIDENVAKATEAYGQATKIGSQMRWLHWTGDQCPPKAWAHRPPPDKRQD